MTEPELGQIGSADEEGADLGEHATASWDGTDLPEWGSEGWVPIGMFGLRHCARGGQIVGLPHGAEERMVALADMWRQQELVFGPYVRQLAAEPAVSFIGDSVVLVIEQADGSYRTTGHHRTCAALAVLGTDVGDGRVL